MASITIGFLVPWFLGGLAVLWFWWRRRLNQLHRRNVRRSRALLKRLRSGLFQPGQMIVYLRKIDPLLFEELVLTAFENSGAPVIRNRRYSGDHGVDGRFWWRHKLVLTQCKRYQGEIHPEHVSAFARAVRREQASAGLFVHTGRTGFASYCALRAAGRSVVLVSGGRLVSLLLGRLDLDELLGTRSRAA
jgi:restriction system protein